MAKRTKSQQIGVTGETLGSSHGDPGRIPLVSNDAVACARVVRTLRELGVGLDDAKRVLAAYTSLVDAAGEHARVLDARIVMLSAAAAVKTCLKPIL